LLGPADLRGIWADFWLNHGVPEVYKASSKHEYKFKLLEREATPRVE